MCDARAARSRKARRTLDRRSDRPGRQPELRAEHAGRPGHSWRVLISALLSRKSRAGVSRKLAIAQSPGTVKAAARPLYRRLVLLARRASQLRRHKLLGWLSVLFAQIRLQPSEAARTADAPVHDSMVAPPSVNSIAKAPALRNAFIIDSLSCCRAAIRTTAPYNIAAKQR
jgi:hypothetical protein